MNDASLSQICVTLARFDDFTFVRSVHLSMKPMEVVQQYICLYDGIESPQLLPYWLDSEIKTL